MKYFLLFILFSATLIAQDIGALLDSIEQRIDKHTNTSSTKQFSQNSKSPALVKSYNQSDLEKYQDLYEFLKFVPGFHIEEERRNLKYIQVRSNSHNSFNNKILVLINGHRIADELGGDTSLDLIPIHAIKRLEIVRGPGSVLYGPNAFAAVIAITSYDGKAYRKNQMEISLGNDQQKKLNIENYFQGDNLSSYMAYSLFNEDGSNFPTASGVKANGHGVPYANIQANQNNTDTRMVYKDVENYRLKDQKNSFFSYTTFKGWDFTFGTMDSSRDKTYLRGTNQEVFYKTSYNYLGVNRKISLSDDLDLKLNSKVSLHRSKYNEFGFDPLVNPLEDIEFVSKSKTKGFDYELEFNYRQSSKHQLVFGAQKDQIFYQRDLFDITFINGFKIPNKVWIPRTKASTSSYYLQSLFEIGDRVTFLSSIRRNLNSIYGINSNPRFGLNVDLGKENYLKISHGTAFRYPTGQEAYYLDAANIEHWNVGLKPEKVKGIDVSIQRVLDKRGSDFTLSYYRQKITDSMVLVDVKGYNRYLNEDPLISKGFEFDLTMKHSNTFSYFLNGSYLKLYRDWGPKASENEVIKNGRVESGDFTHSTLSHMLSFGFDKKLSKNLSLYWSAKYVGEQRHRADDRYAYPHMGGYTTHNLGVKLTNKENGQIKLVLDNAFNKKYVYPDYDISASKIYSYPKGRSIVLSYKFKF
ncbi:MAG: TonB-dependent receptor [Candidatus Cloacimonetes bacterium]|nr:TonB-dependent receptor [Candidatus Cloacimonadota bacterium]